MALDPLASVDDLEARLGRALNDVEAVRAVPLLRDASAGARREAGRPFTAAADETARVRVRSADLRLPKIPVTAVASIADVDGNDLEFTYYGGDTVRLTFIPAAGWADVTYSHGYAEVPDDVTGAVCSAVLRTLGISPLETGYQSENVEGYGYSVGSAAAAGAVGFLPSELAVFHAYRRIGGMARLGP